MKSFWTLLLVIGLSVVFVSSGCKKSPYVPVTGKVSLDGGPLEEAMVTYIPKNSAEGVTASSYTNAQGVYTLQTSGGGEAGTGTKPGDYTVTVKKTIEKWDGKTWIESPGFPKVKDTYAQDVTHKIYADPMRTPFKATVTSDPKKNVFDFELVSKP